MHYQFYQYLNQHNLLSGKQFGFRPKHSTANAVSSQFADEIVLNMERGKLCGAGFLDLSKAFATVDHTILLRKLSSFGVASDSPAKWFEPYLNGRMQCTSCGPELSDLLPVTHGVPQGKPSWSRGCPESDLHAIANWLNDNKLTLNVDKTKC